MSVALRRQSDGYDVSTIDILKRTDAVRDAVSSAAMEGVKIDDAAMGVLGQFATGAITEDEMIEQGLTMYGPGA